MKHQKLINSGTPALVNNSTFIILLFAASGVFPIQAIRNSLLLLLQAPHRSLSSQAAEDFRTKGSHAVPCSQGYFPLSLTFYIRFSHS